MTKTKLDPLPDDDTTEDLQLGDPLTCNRDDHFFVQRSGTACECNKCHMGFVLSVGCYVDEGHIKSNEGMVI